ncbi:response regulator transcription factor [Streptomyces sp. GMY02]|uniref:response regulator n=1 Tax=Streptomyces sp. GMY02 TaxID=1333528 RepID=UPI001C2BF464|nr:response regulator transcription factor [Streptomyces sp. GMY02]QXE38416.1 response regulator transcription factor [Streptomyces sp. GMY02]
MIKVLLVDDHELVRTGFRVVLGAAPDIEVVGEARTGTEALAAVRRERPDIVLMDIRMPDMDGIEATQRICAESDDARVIMLTTFELSDHVVGAIRAGASGFLGKGCDPARLVEAIRSVAAGESLLSSKATLHVLERVRSMAEGPRVGTYSLTAREAEVVDLVAQGLSNHEIAARLDLSPLTVKTHVSRIMVKLGARDRAQLVAWYYQGHTGVRRP